MVISLAQKFLSCAKFRPLRVIKKDIILLKPADFASTKECFKRSRWFGKRHKTVAFTKLGNLISELHVPHRQCLAGIISNSVSVSFSSIWPSFPRYYCSPNKACATPAGTYRVQYPGFPRLLTPLFVYSARARTHTHTQARP